MRFLTCMLFAAALFSLSACIDFAAPAFTAESEEHLVRLDAEADTLELVSIQHGLRAGGGDVLVHLGALAAGRRVFPAQGGFLSADFDDLQNRPSSEDESSKDRSLRSLAGGLHLDEVVLGLEGEGRITLWRRARLTNAAAWLACAQSADEPRGAAPFTLGEFPTLDERTFELAVAAFGRGEPFLKLSGDGLVLEMPSTTANTAGCLAEIADVLVAGDQATASLLGNLRDLEASAERLKARIGPDASGWIRLGWSSSVPAGDGAGAFLTAEQLVAAGLSVQSDADFAARLATVAAR